MADLRVSSDIDSFLQSASRQAAMDNLAGATTSGQYLRGNGSDVVMSGIQAGDVPTLNQNTTGTAGNVSGTVAVANGGTGQTTRQAAMDALAGAVTAGQYLRGDGTDVVMSALQAADLTGTVAVANGGTGASTAGNATRTLGGMQTAQIRHASNLVLATAGTITGGVWTINSPIITFTSTTATLVPGMSLSAGVVTGVIRTVDSPTQITMTLNAGSSGSGSITVFNASLTTLVSSSVVVMDNRTMQAGDIFVLSGQTATAQNGPWRIDSIGTGFTCSRPSWFTGSLIGPIFAMIQYGTNGTGSVVGIQTASLLLSGSITVGLDALIVVISLIGRSPTASTSTNTFTGPQTLRANGTAANQAAAYFQAGSLMTTPQAHALEWDGTSMHLTTGAAVRTTNVVNTAIPSTSTSAGVVGQIAVDNVGNWLYVCTATNVWKRVALTTF